MWRKINEKKLKYSLGIGIAAVVVIVTIETISFRHINSEFSVSQMKPSFDLGKRTSFTFKKPIRLADDKKRRIKELEQTGYVPMGSGSENMFLAQYTSWWGQPLDPEEFWQDEVIWFDSRARARAEHYGRRFPPIPSHIDMETIPGSNKDDYWLKPIAWKHANPNYVQTEQERTFWFFRRHLLPRSPEEIDTKQLEIAKSILRTKIRLQNAKNEIRGCPRNNREYTPEQLEVELNKTRESYQKRAIDDFDFPPEPFQNQNMLLYSYVKDQRDKYHKAVDKDDERGKNRILRSLMVDKSYITNDLEPSFVARGTAWQANYLSRLRNEGWDESYVEAYKKAWDVKNFD
ncbi:MAG: hypothetical protein PF692_05135 [Kiritimatiellae bacterium]|jgi:hypothetical protein|nr:hypothetical protein [Kiritimatiellia bacterium]